MMKKYFKIKKWYSIFLLAFVLTACEYDEAGIPDDSVSADIRTDTEIAVSTGTASTRAGALMPSADGVMMQAFYWDVEPQGEWWNNITGKLDGWSANGINAIWIPPVSKGNSGFFSMGYDPYDYFDFGDFDQHGTVKTRFGNRAELDAMITKAHDNNIAVIADMVINHNSGGDLQRNRFTDVETYTLFNPLSEKFDRQDVDFHPNALHAKDEGRFGGFPDLDLLSDYVRNWMWQTDQSVAHYYMNDLMIDGWRFDFVKGYSTTVVKDWIATIGGWTVGEYYDGNLQLLQEWANAAEADAFDFPNFFNMRDAFRNNDLTNLDKDALFKADASKAVTFVGNHDTEDRSDNNDDFPDEYQSHAYAYILTAPGYPCVFYTHYETDGDKDNINMLIDIRKELAAGDMEVLYSGTDEYIVARKGDGTKNGLILYLNISDVDKSRDVITPWISTNIKDFTGNVFLFSSADATGLATLKAPAKSFAVWSSTTETQIAFPAMLYLPGDYQGWNPAAALTLSSVNTPNIDGLYQGNITMPNTANQFKFTDAPDWANGIYGDQGTGTSGIIASPGNNITLNGPFDYEINVDLINNTWSANTWGIIGDATPDLWNSDQDMRYDQTQGYWFISLNITGGEYKFRANDDWTLNYGDEGADGTLEAGGANIAPAAGNYMIWMKLSNKTHGFGNWGLIGSAIPVTGWDSDQDITYDNTTKKWSITLDLIVGEIKFRFADDWAINLGDNNADGSMEYGGANIAIATNGNYTIELDISDPGNYSYTVTKN